jgi:hypothetical protein
MGYAPWASVKYYSTVVVPCYSNVGLCTLATQKAASAHVSPPPGRSPIMYSTMSDTHSLGCLCPWRVCQCWSSAQNMCLRAADCGGVSVGVLLSSAQSIVCAPGIQCILGFQSLAGRCCAPVVLFAAAPAATQHSLLLSWAMHFVLPRELSWAGLDLAACLHTSAEPGCCQ